MMTAVFFECSRCTERQSPEDVVAVCPHCGGSLAVRYDRSKSQTDNPLVPSEGRRDRAELPRRRSLGGIIQPY
jgi:hypothetical protein